MSRMRVSPDDDFTLELELDELAPAADAPAVLARKLAARLGGSPAELPPLEIRKRSLDARHGRSGSTSWSAPPATHRSVARRCARATARRS